MICQLLSSGSKQEKMWHLSRKRFFINTVLHSHLAGEDRWWFLMFASSLSNFLLCPSGFQALAARDDDWHVRAVQQQRTISNLCRVHFPIYGLDTKPWTWSLKLQKQVELARLARRLSQCRSGGRQRPRLPV